MRLFIPTKEGRLVENETKANELEPRRGGERYPPVLVRGVLDDGLGELKDEEGERDEVRWEEERVKAPDLRRGEIIVRGAVVIVEARRRVPNHGAVGASGVFPTKRQSQNEQRDHGHERREGCESGEQRPGCFLRRAHRGGDPVEGGPRTGIRAAIKVALKSADAAQCRVPNPGRCPEWLGIRAAAPHP